MTLSAFGSDSFRLPGADPDMLGQGAQDIERTEEGSPLIPLDEEPTLGLAILRSMQEEGELPEADINAPDPETIDVASFGDIAMSFFRPMMRLPSRVKRFNPDVAAVHASRGLEPPEGSAAEMIQRVTGVGREKVADRIVEIIPPQDRVADGLYQVGRRENGLGFRTFSEDELNANMGNIPAVQKELDDALIEIRDRVSQEARDQMDATGFRAPLIDELNVGANTSNNARFWYELGGEEFQTRLPDLSEDEMFLTLDLIGRTSGLTDPEDNLFRTLAVLSQHVRGVPIDVDLVSERGVAEAFQLFGTKSFDLDKNKTGHFSQTFAYTQGIVPIDQGPISVNDTWMGAIHGITGEVLANNQALHEPMALFQNFLRDLINERVPAEKLLNEPMQSWQTQALSWTGIRGEPGDFSMGFGAVYQRLRKAGIEIADDEPITRAILEDPRFIDALRPRAEGFRESFKATVEFGTELTANGRAAIGRYAEAVMEGDTKEMAEFTSILTGAMVRSGRGKQSPLQLLMDSITGMPKSSSRIGFPTSDRPFDFAGSYEGKLAPNLVFPLKVNNPDGTTRQFTAEERRVFNAFIAKNLNQQAGGSAQFITPKFPAREVGEDTVGHFGLFVETARDMAPRDQVMSVQILQRIAPGFELKYARSSNGYMIDFFPRFNDDFTKSPITLDIIERFVSNSHLRGENRLKVIERDFTGIYGYDLVERTKTGRTGAIDKILRDFERSIFDDAEADLIKLGLTAKQAKNYAKSTRGLEAVIAKLAGNVRKRARTVRRRRLRRSSNFATATSDQVAETLKLDQLFGDYAARTRPIQRTINPALMKKERDGLLEKAIANFNRVGVGEGDEALANIRNSDLVAAGAGIGGALTAASAVQRHEQLGLGFDIDDQ